jgi:hypothetical protein
MVSRQNEKQLPKITQLLTDGRGWLGLEEISNGFCGLD